MIIQGSAKEMPFDDGTFDAIITSPPYFGLRVYGDSDDEIGKGSLVKYLKDMWDVGVEMQRVLKDDGVLWVNIGDTASGSGGAGGDYNKGGRQEGRPKWRQGASGLAPKQWCNVPARLSILYQDMGWLLRAEVTWDKERLRPESLDHVRRPGVSSEKIFMFSKTPNYKFDPQGLLEKGSVWHFPPESAPRSHLAPFPIELPRRCLLCSTEPGDKILDPFAGRGTTLQAAAMYGRVGYGLDLYTEES